MVTQSKTYEKNGLQVNTEITPHDDGLCTLEISVTNGTEKEIKAFLEELNEAAKDMGVEFTVANMGRVN